MSKTVIIIIAVVALIVVAATCAVMGIRYHLRRRRVMEFNKRDDDQVRYAFIINPSKPTAERSRARIKDFCDSKGITDIEFIDTTLERTGRDCALEAMRHGADVLVAVGGDGTVRTVASAVSGTGKTLAIVPIGTGNLFARNMGIPVDDIEAALTVATSRGERLVDMGRMALMDRDDDHAHAFLIIAGTGFDADMIDDTDPELKKNISWLAYFSGGMKHLFAPKYRASVAITKPDGNTHTVSKVHFRTFMAGNCGQIPVFSLMPNAVYDDGLLDFEIIDTNGGLFGWFNLLGGVVQQTITGKVNENQVSESSTMDQIQGVSAELLLEKPALAQVDGDMLGTTSHIRFTVEPKALKVRVPSPAPVGQSRQ